VDPSRGTSIWGWAALNITTMHNAAAMAMVMMLSLQLQKLSKHGGGSRVESIWTWPRMWERVGQQSRLATGKGQLALSVGAKPIYSAQRGARGRGGGVAGPWIGNYWKLNSWHLGDFMGHQECRLSWLFIGQITAKVSVCWWNFVGSRNLCLASIQLFYIFKKL